MASVQNVVAKVGNIIYDEKGIDMIKQLLSQTKGGQDTEDGIAHAVATVALTILGKMQKDLSQLSEEEIFGNHGVVHATLDGIFEVAKTLGFKTKKADLKTAYEVVDQALQEGAGQEQQGAPVPPQQGMPQMQPQPVPGPMTGALQ